MSSSSNARNARADVCCFGEIIVDFFPEEPGRALRHTRTFTMNQGGAPANVAVGVSRLGHHSAMLGAVGDDEFGAFLIDALAADDVDTGSIVVSTARTAITFVSVDSVGERGFHFFRNETADLMMDAADVPEEAVRGARIVHFGSNLLTAAPSRRATARVLELAERGGSLISFDPNLRVHLWKRLELGIERVLATLPRAHLVKVSDEENALLAPRLGPREAFDRVYGPAGVTALFVTHGAAGATVVTERLTVAMPAPVVDVIDTTGAGDGFVSGLLSGLLKRDVATPSALPALAPSDWRDVLALANRVGAHVCSRLGATSALPTTVELAQSRPAG